MPKNLPAKELPPPKSQASNPASESVLLPTGDPKPVRSRTKAAVAPAGLSPQSDFMNLS